VKALKLFVITRHTNKRLVRKLPQARRHHPIYHHQSLQPQSSQLLRFLFFVLRVFRFQTKMEGQNEVGNALHEASHEMLAESGDVPCLDGAKKDDSGTSNTSSSLSSGSGSEGARQPFRGIAMSGKYARVSGGKKKDSVPSYWDDRSNVVSDIPGFSHVYYNVMVPKGEEELYLSPGMNVVLASGKNVRFAALVTRNGVGSNVVVADTNGTNPELVNWGDIDSVVEPTAETSTDWVRGVLESCGKQLEDEKKNHSNTKSQRGMRL